jgi:hypothetical protein
MPLLGFTVFKDKILDGSKTQTIRKLRKYPIKEGDKLYLYWHPRQKDCEKLGEAVCIEEYKISMSIDQGNLCVLRLDHCFGGNVSRLSFDETYRLALADGFAGVADMGMWFMKTHSNLDGETFQVIRWRNK